MDPPRKSEKIPYVSTRFSLSMEMGRLTRYGTAEPVSRDQILGRERGQGNIRFSVQLATSRTGNRHLVDPYLAICDDHTYIPHIKSNLDRLGLLPPTHGQRSQQQSGQITFSAGSMALLSYMITTILTIYYSVLLRLVALHGD